MNNDNKQEIHLLNESSNPIADDDGNKVGNDNNFYFEEIKNEQLALRQTCGGGPDSPNGAGLNR